MLKRRNFVKTAFGGLLGAGLLRFTPAFSANAVKAFRLSAARGSFKFAHDQTMPAQVMYYNQSIPGPVIRIPQGSESIIEFHNALDEATTVHWHGLRIDNAMDGVPEMTQAAVLPGKNFSYRLTPPDAGTYWYHTHQRSWAQLALGLAGVLIVEETHAPEVDQDIVLAIDDWRLDDNLQFDAESLGSLHDWAHGGRLGDYITVNGEFDKVYRVSRGERIRLRLVNIANSRIMKLRFHLPHIFVVAIDGQPVTAYAPESGTVTLAPGQRSDLIIDMSAEPGEESPIELLVRDRAYRVASFEFSADVKREQLLDASPALPLNPANKIALPKQFKRFPLLMEGGAMGRMNSATYEGKQMDIRELIEHRKIWAINGVAGLPEVPLFRVERGSAIELAVENDNAWPHAMHIHGHHFIYDKSPEVWRDTVLIARGEKGSMKFIADNPGKWLIHCHMVEHMAGGMLTWFEVT